MIKVELRDRGRSLIMSDEKKSRIKETQYSPSSRKKRKRIIEKIRGGTIFALRNKRRCNETHAGETIGV